MCLHNNNAKSFRRENSMPALSPYLLPILLLLGSNVFMTTAWY